MKRFHKLNLDFEKTIQYEQSHRKCFFQKDYIKMTWNRQKLSKYFADFDIVQVVIMENKKQLKKPYTIMIKENVIARTKKDGNIIWMDYENSILEPISDNIHGKGVKLTKCFDQLVIFGDLDQLLPIFKRYTIQLEFAKHFQIIKKLNHQEKFEVFRIRSKIDRNDYECKIYDKKFLNATTEKQLEKELHILRRINEESIQKYYETFENQEQIIIIQELIIGGNLEQYLLKWPLLSEDKSSKLFFRLFKTIAYLHSKGIMHRDLKPENIGLRLNGNLDNPCITSFQLADIVCIDNDVEEDEEENPKHLFQRCGTPGFVAPEILQNQQYDCKVDVYSMGIMIYYSLTGKRPFDSPDYKELLAKNEEGNVDLSNLKLSKEGMQFMSDILEPDPEQRITAQAALNHVWFRSEKLNRIMEFKTHKRLKQKQFKSPYQRLSVQNSPNLLPQILINQRLEQSCGSPILQKFGNTVRNSVNSTIFRITTINGSFSPKQIQFNSTHYTSSNGSGKFGELSPSLFAQRSSQSKSFLQTVHVKQIKTIENK